MSELAKEEPCAKPRLPLEAMHYKGVLISKCDMDEIKEMDTRDDDVWVCTFPRSGTTLTQELVYLIQTLDFDTANSVQLDDRFPIIDVQDDRYPYYRAPECPWPRHVLGYWERRNDSNVLLLKYEELITDLPNGVRKIAAFLGRTISDDDVSKICEHCSVDNMRANDKVNMSYWRDIKHVNDKAHGRFINQGIAGAWKQKMTAEESAKVDGLISEVEKYGLKFDDA